MDLINPVSWSHMNVAGAIAIERSPARLLRAFLCNVCASTKVHFNQTNHVKCEHTLKHITRTGNK